MMNFQTIIKQLSFPVFESNSLFTHANKRQQVQRQLSEWTRQGKIMPLRRGLYTVAEPYQFTQLHPFVIANHLVRDSYVSLQMALSYYGLIPDHVAVITNVTSGRSNGWENHYGRFEYHHIQPSFFTGAHLWQLTATQSAWIATPEKALLDLIYLTPGGDSSDYLHALRLQNLDQFDLQAFYQWVKLLDKPKLHRAVSIIEELMRTEAQEYQLL